jgi:uncharacterized Tic20 family protein
MNESLVPNQDERVMAALSHISIILPFMGLIASIVIWVTQKEKSRFVAFHALQALVYQLVEIMAWFLGIGCYFSSFLGTIIVIPLTSSAGSSSVDVLFVLIPLVVMGFIFLGGFAFMVYGVVGAILTFQGKPFHYLLVGRRVERFMQPKA